MLNHQKGLIIAVAEVGIEMYDMRGLEKELIYEEIVRQGREGTLEEYSRVVDRLPHLFTLNDMRRIVFKLFGRKFLIQKSNGQIKACTDVEEVKEFVEEAEPGDNIEVHAEGRIINKKKVER